MSTGGHQQGEARHAEGVVCTICGYGLAGVPHGLCPECGKEQGDRAAEIRRERDAMLEWWKQWRVRWMVGWAVAVIGISLIANVVSRDPLIMALGIWGVLALQALVSWALVIALGMLLALRVQQDQRPLVRVAWMRSMWALQLAWFVSPIGAGTIQFIALAQQRNGPTIPVVDGWLKAFALVTITIAGIGISLWGVRFFRMTRGRMGLQLSKSTRVLAVGFASLAVGLSIQLAMMTLILVNFGLFVGG